MAQETFKLRKIPLTTSARDFVRTQVAYTGNAQISREQADADTTGLNQPETLRNNFLNVPTLEAVSLGSGAVVETLVPTGQYTPGAVMVIALRREIVHRQPIKLKDGRVPTLQIYDYPMDAQLEYFRQVLTAMDVLQEEFQKHTEHPYNVVAVTNAAKVTSNLQARLSRTIAEPHSQVGVFLDHEDPFTPNVPQRLFQERRLIAFMTDHIATKLEHLTQSLNKFENIQSGYEIRVAPPHGYIITTPIHRDLPTNEKAALLQKIMSMHHRIYENESLALEAKITQDTHPLLNRLLLPQPSYRAYQNYNSEGFLEISISPIIFASSGVVEALDREVDRNPENPAYFANDDERKAYYDAIAQRLKQVERESTNKDPVTQH